jgi:hypothetical protein
MEAGYTTMIDNAKGERKEEATAYNPVLLIPLILVLGLNVLDSLFTIMVLDFGGYEINPVTRSVITLYGDGFWIWKFVIVSVSLVLLCLHSQLKMVKVALLSISTLYTVTVCYQVMLLR